MQQLFIVTAVSSFMLLIHKFVITIFWRVLVAVVPTENMKCGPAGNSHIATQLLRDNVNGTVPKD